MTDEQPTAPIDWAALNRLYATLIARKSADPEQSYVARLYGKGRQKIAQKLGEEAVETALAGVLDDRAGIISESADLLFHLMVLWADAGIAPDDIMAELTRREGLSGLEEKKRRTL
ncbi:MULTISPECIES: phosphoribosyl-ATP diphosphatase [unclassified Iodidimonas]|jgi:phosphoribosyl-ATP pyrophosphohydrolase|uniref:phosphoribosyl-ATP diphosphatase n=1 Tax=unclassified Iodidimonas TaxID=2626145 RepID=UPI0024826EB3|nr:MULTISPECIES: phosphoribosyl-ATP diphosphatase [unclassified Iodidimonas]